MEADSHQAAHVVLVDDDPSLLHALRFAFEADGYAVTTLESGEALLEAALGGECLCMVVDQRLPGVAGLETLECLRSRGIAAPAILMTSNPSRNLLRRAAAAGIPVVEKPLLGDLLSLKVREALDGARRQPGVAPARA